MSKKLIRVVSAPWMRGDIYINYSKALNFAFAGPEETTKEDGTRVRTQVSKFVGCREILCKDFRAYAHNFSVSSSQTKTGNPADMNTLRLIITVAKSSMDKDDAKNRIFAGKRAINLFEAYGNFPSQSVITSVVHDNSNYKMCWLLTGPIEWVSTPQLLSFMTLLLRASYHLNGGLSTDSIEDLIAQFESFKSKGNPGFSMDSDEDLDLGRLHKLSKHILRVFDVREKLFFPDITKAYDGSDRFSDYGYGGIESLFSLATGQTELNNRFKSLVLDHNAGCLKK